MRWRGGVMIGGLAAAVVLNGAVVSATAAPLAGKVTKSHAIAGYVVGLTGGATYSVTVAVPVVDCSAGESGATGLIVAAGGSQPGFSSGGGVEATCSGTTAVYTGYVNVNGDTQDIPGVNGGDQVTVTGTAGPTGEDVTWTDTTSSLSGSASGAGVALSDFQVSASGEGTFPIFTTIDWSAVTIDSAPLGNLSPQRVKQVDGHKKAEITTSKVKAGHDSFVNKYVSNT